MDGMPLLKSLELHGYKTFASRTLFEFPGMVTAIVGPNGSGKSNIADSLRWVLGEQSYSLLRGRKTEDMIFSGSEQRTRAGMASASITFDNENGWLPIDYSEVSIARRAYRDGNNEYLLNGQRVRLKEIAELLAQSGLAERTYTIIGQGLVDAALSLKPEERRRFFEEAAGIGLYRARREESLNRLDTTRRNLERVLDILSELEPRLHSLERQAKRAMEYDQIRADLRMLLRDWYGFHWHRNQVELVHARDVLHAQEDRLNLEREQQGKVEEQLNQVRARLQELRTRLNEWHRQSAELHTRRERASRALAVMDERQRSLAGQQRSAESDLARLEEEQKARQDRLAELEEERARLQEEYQEAGERAKKALAALEKRQAERAQIDGKLRDARRALVSAETRQVQVKARGDELANRQESLRASRKALDQAAARDTEDLERARARLAMWEKNRELAEAELRQAEEALRAQRQAIGALDDQRRQMQEERGRVDTERSRLAAQGEVLEQAERSLSGLANGAKYLLQEARQGRLKGGYRTLSSALVVPAELETAIAAALGEYLDGVLLEQGSDLEEALASLSQGEKGRAVLLPLGDSRQAEVLSALNDEACLGVAAELVQAGDDLQPALRLLLGQVLVVRDRQAGRRLARNLPGWARAVTLQGEVFLGNGAVVAGKEGKASNLIGRTRRIQELQQMLAESSRRLEEAQAGIKRLDETLAGQRSREKELDGELRQKQSGLSKANQGYQQAALETEQVRQRQEYQTRQAANLDGQLQKTETEIRQVKQEFEGGAVKVNETSELVRELNRQLSGLPLEELQAEMNSLEHRPGSQRAGGARGRPAPAGTGREHVGRAQPERDFAAAPGGSRGRAEPARGRTGTGARRRRRTEPADRSVPRADRPGRGAAQPGGERGGQGPGQPDCRTAGSHGSRTACHSGAARIGPLP